MLFNSYAFLIFLPVVCIVFHLLPQKAKNPWLLLCSYYFYGSWNWAYLGLIFASTLVTYLVALWLEALSKQRNSLQKRKLVLALNLVINLGLLFVFKYFGLFASLSNAMGAQVRALDLMLPVGISFYTFQSLGYCMDVYRGDIACERHFFTYALFVSFFPQLVAGPIERAGNLLPQFQKEHRFCYESLRKGMLLLLWGFFLKLLIADRAAQVTEYIYGLESATGFQYAVATFLFSFQIYGDFAGYSVIAMGAAEILGFRLMRNFDQPYFSQSVSEFWRRWHVSLSGWFRDYVYYPLGGNRKGTARTLFNLMLVFLLSGLWHGAALTFVVWGFAHGLLQCMERLLLGRRIKRVSGLAGVLRMVITFVFITLAWVPFRAQNLAQCKQVLGAIFSPSLFPIPSQVIGQTVKTFGISKAEVIAMALSVCVLWAVDARQAKAPGLADRIEARSLLARWPIYYALAFVVLIFGVYGTSQGSAAFLYFQF